MTACATCGISLPLASPNSPTVRYCQDHWWDEQVRRFDADEEIDADVRYWLTTPRTTKTAAKYLGVRA